MCFIEVYVSVFCFYNQHSVLLMFINDLSLYVPKSALIKLMLDLTCLWCSCNFPPLVYQVYLDIGVTFSYTSASVTVSEYIIDY